MAHSAHGTASLPRPLFQVRATASEDLPLGARLPAPWPVVLFVLVTAAVVAAWAGIDRTPLSVPSTRVAQVVERTGTAADPLAPEWVFELEQHRFDAMVREHH